jgi:hypothetical protein
MNMMRKSQNECFASINGQKGELFRLKVEYESDPARVLHVSYYS